MNIAKLVRRNLSKPMHLRISSNEILERVASGVAVVRGNSVALLAQIHEEEKEKFAALRNVQDWCAEV